MNHPQDSAIYGNENEVFEEQNNSEVKRILKYEGDERVKTILDDTEPLNQQDERTVSQSIKDEQYTILDFSDNSLKSNNEQSSNCHIHSKVKENPNDNWKTAENMTSRTCYHNMPDSNILEMICDETNSKCEGCDRIFKNEILCKDVEVSNKNDKIFSSNLVDKSFQHLENSKSILDACGIVDSEIKTIDTRIHTEINNSDIFCGQTILDHADSKEKDTKCRKHLEDEKCDCVSDNTNHKHDSGDQKSKNAMLSADVSQQKDGSEVFSAADSFQPMDEDHVLSADSVQPMEIGDITHKEAFIRGKSENKSQLMNTYVSTSYEEEQTKVDTDVYDIDVDSDDSFTHNSSFNKFRSKQFHSESNLKTKSSFDSLDNSEQRCNIFNRNDSIKKNPPTCKKTEVIGQEISSHSMGKHETIKTEIQENGNCQRKTDVSNKQEVVYVYSKELVQICDQMQKIPNRASMVHSLIQSYGLTKYMSIVAPRQASEEEIKKFHDPDYIEFLQKMAVHDDTEKYEVDAAQYGLTYDCPIHQGLYEYASMTAGATIVAAECLVQDKCKVAINWCGGWHHAARDQASGFCYVNDIVLGILKLKERFGNVLYVDLDLHHGDGVEDAFSATPKVMTVSFHKYAPGFFPGTGSLNDVGIGKGIYYTVNVPLLDGIRDAEFTPLVCRILNKVKETFQPEAVVCQCGADGLAGDPMESFNLTHKGLGKCVYFILQWNLPTMILGGGGYNLSNTARCWTFLTALAAGKQLPSEIPDHQYFMDYGPDYEIEVLPGNRKNHNTPHYLRQVYGTVMNNINKIDLSK